MGVKLRGEGGGVWEFELPLSETFADQVKSRKLVPDDDESAAAVAHLLATEEEAEAATGTNDGLDGLKKAELEQLAAEEGIDLSSAKSNADKVAAIRAHRAEAANGDDE